MRKLFVIIPLFFVLVVPFKCFSKTIVMASGEWPPYTSSTISNARFADILVAKAFKTQRN